MHIYKQTLLTRYYVKEFVIDRKILRQFDRHAGILKAQPVLYHFSEKRFKKNIFLPENQ